MVVDVVVVITVVIEWKYISPQNTPWRPRDGVEVLYLYSFFNHGTRWGGCSTPRPSPLAPGKNSRTLITGGWVGPTREGQGKHELDSMKNNKSLSRCDVVFMFVTTLMSHLCTAITTHNTPENKCINLHAQHTTELQTNVFLTTTHRSLATNRGRSAFPSAKKIQGQLQTPRSVGVVFTERLALDGTVGNK